MSCNNVLSIFHNFTAKTEHYSVYLALTNDPQKCVL